MPVLTVEIGGGLLVWDNLLEQGVRGIHNVLKNRGMLSGEIELPKKQVLIKDDKRFSSRSTITGLLHKRVQLGDSVHVGDELAYVSDPASGATESVTSNHCGVIFSLITRDKVTSDDTIGSVLQTGPCKPHGTEANIETEI